MQYRSLFIELANKSCFVIGGGTKALSISKTLLQDGALVTCWSEEFIPNFSDLAKQYQGQLSLLQATFSQEVAEHYCSAKVRPFVVIAASTDPKENLKICQVCRDNNVLSCNPDTVDSETVLVTNYRSSPANLAVMIEGQTYLSQLIQNKLAKDMAENWLPAIQSYSDYQYSDYVSNLDQVEQRIFLRLLAEQLVKQGGNFTAAENAAKKAYTDLQDSDDFLLELADERAQMG